jgi:tRNA threonylcarbamoyladenosine modification (KEOPS) complex Cgi121 subunit
MDQINISDSFNTELLLVLSATDQINKINKELFLEEGKNKNNEVFVILVSENEIKAKNMEIIKKDLSLKIIPDEKIKFNKKEALAFYKIKEPDAENKIIEKMALAIVEK